MGNRMSIVNHVPELADALGYSSAWKLWKDLLHQVMSQPTVYKLYNEPNRSKLGTAKLAANLMGCKVDQFFDVVTE